MFHITVVQAGLAAFIFFVLDFVNFGLMYVSKEDGRTRLDVVKGAVLIAAQVLFAIYLVVSFFIVR